VSAELFDAGAVRAWLDTVHGDPQGFVVISHFDGKTFPSESFDDLDRAAAYVVRQDARRRPQGIYLRTTTVAVAPATGRGNSTDSLALPGFAGDVDFGQLGHSHDPAMHDGRPLPPDEESARKIVTTSGLPDPTLWVHSGGGLYPWWLLVEPYMLAGDHDEIAALSNHLQQMLGESATALGWHYGTGVGDLARVLRIPGTVNRKAGVERACRIVQNDGVRYTLAELRAACAEPAEGRADGSAQERTGSSWRSKAASPAVGPSAHAVRSCDSSVWDSMPRELGPFDALAESARWSDIFEPAGWTLVRTEGDGAELWLRPGNAESEYSARAGGCNGAVVVVFSESAGLPTGAGQKLTMPRLFALLHHAGDESAAARDLRAAAANDPTSTVAARALPLPVLATIRERCGIVAKSDMACRTSADAAAGERSEFDRLVASEALKLRVRSAAADIVKSESAELAVVMPEFTGLDDFLAVPDEQQRYRIEGLMPIGARVIASAQFKAGKSTLRDNFIRSLADDVPFLDHFDVFGIDGRIAVIDDELDERTMRLWLREQGVVNTKRVEVLSLRGRVGTLDLLDAECRAGWAKSLRDRDVQLVILDCLRPVLDALGLSEDKDAGRFLVAFDALLAESGATESLMLHHMGHVEGRSRGDSRLRDWPDVEWKLVRLIEQDGSSESNAQRFFSAYGRDVDVSEGLLTYEPANRHLTYAGGSRKQTSADAAIPALVAFVKANEGLTQNKIEAGMAGSEFGKDKIRAGLRRAIALDLIDVIDGPRNSNLHVIPALRITS
jgi:hypothetical protein